jgi:hypothetical protein
MDDSEYCKGCAKQCEKNESGKPTNGTIQDRLSSDFKGPKGDAPKHYTAIMKKLKLTKEQVQEEASKFGIEIAEEHFATPENKTKRGRPKKAASSNDSEATPATAPKKRGRPPKQPKDVKSDGTDDLFANLVSNVQEDDVSSMSGSESEGEADAASKASSKSKQTAEEKASKKAAAEAEKASKKAAAEAEKASKKAAAEAEKAEKKAAAEAEKAEKAEKKAALEAEKAEKKAALEAKKAAKQESESKKAAKQESESKKAGEEPATLKVKKFEYKGTKYLKSANGVVYNMEQDEVGTWNEETKEIDFKVAESEEEEEDYESGDE